MRTLQTQLTLWTEGLLERIALVDWAAAQIAAQDEPAWELIELVLEGPEACMRKTEFDFPIRPLELTYADHFALRAVVLDLTDDAASLRFCGWAAQAALAEDLENPMVKLGYRLDHWLVDCENATEALRCLREQLPALLPECRERAARLGWT